MNDRAKWLASQYLDDARWGVLDDENRIILGVRFGFTEEQCRAIAAAHNDGD